MEDLYCQAQQTDRLHCSGCRDKILKHRLLSGTEQHSKQQGSVCQDKQLDAVVGLGMAPASRQDKDVSQQFSGPKGIATMGSGWKLWQRLKLKGCMHS